MQIFLKHFLLVTIEIFVQPTCKAIHIGIHLGNDVQSAHGWWWKVASSENLSHKVLAMEYGTDHILLHHIQAHGQFGQRFGKLFKHNVGFAAKGGCTNEGERRKREKLQYMYMKEIEKELLITYSAAARVIPRNISSASALHVH